MALFRRSLVWPVDACPGSHFVRVVLQPNKEFPVVSHQDFENLELLKQQCRVGDVGEAGAPKGLWWPKLTRATDPTCAYMDMIAHISIHIYYMHIYICLYVFACLRICLHTNMYVDVCIYMHVCVCFCILYVCLYPYIYICIHIHTNIYAALYAQREMKI